MYKITVNGITFVGNNEDSWRTDPQIWFEPATDQNFGAVYVGYAGKNLPDGGMNEHGLVFDAFTMPHIPGIPARDPSKPDFGYGHVKRAIQQFKTVEEVQIYFSGMNLNVLNGSPLFNGGMLLFVDQAGNYLAVEAGGMTTGSESSFLLVNVSVCGTTDYANIKVDRFQKGMSFLARHPAQSSIGYCTALSDTISVDRPKIGDGTLYSTIYDVQTGDIHTYFFHDFSKKITFNLHEELAKGPHSHRYSELFPGNDGFARFLDFRTPQNSRVLMTLLVVIGIVLVVSSFVLFFYKKRNMRAIWRWALILLNAVLLIYLYFLLRNPSIYYFAAPYVAPYSVTLTLFGYLPMVLLFLFPVFLIGIIRGIKAFEWTVVEKSAGLISCGGYLVLLVLFGYWQLFFHP
jgi:hypothetical protein